MLMHTLHSFEKCKPSKECQMHTHTLLHTYTCLKGCTVMLCNSTEGLVGGKRHNCLVPHSHLALPGFPLWRMFRPCVVDPKHRESRPFQDIL